MTTSIMPRSLKRIVVLEERGDAVTPVILYEGPTLRKRSSPALRPIERAVRKMYRAQAAFANSYIERHERSNLREKDGWLKDFGKNMKRSLRTARRQVDE